MRSSCGSFRAGHDAHWIQVLKVAPRGTPVAVHDVRIVDPVTLELDVDRVGQDAQETLVLRNHDAVQAFTAWNRWGEARVVHGASLMMIGPSSGAAAFSVTPGELGACRSEDTEEGGLR